jgi:AbrB family looped-hinge helix DNA binding protein
VFDSAGDRIGVFRHGDIPDSRDSDILAKHPEPEDPSMELVKLGKKGQVTIPKSILRSIGIPDEAPLLVETTPDGAIVLRQAAVYPIELYTEEQLAEYEESNTVPPALERRVEALAARRSRKK